MNTERYRLLDVLRGVTLLSMVGYHVMFDLVELYDIPVEWFWKLPGYVWQQSICWVFILLSGFCWQLGRHPVRRGLIISVCGLLVTIGTALFLPEERILYGILSFTGAAMLVLALLHPCIRKIPAWMGFLISGLFFFLTRDINIGYWGFETFRLGAVPESWYQGSFMNFLGFPEKGFFSGDYFSFLPWFFLYLCGYFLYGILMKRDLVKQTLKMGCRPLEWPGRYSLPIYLIHQPLAILVLECIF
jgi:uncharacterized membrane protein